MLNSYKNDSDLQVNPEKKPPVIYYIHQQFEALVQNRETISPEERLT